MSESEQAEVRVPICGIVMPISAIDGCNESHWNDVMEILNNCIEEAGFEPNLVSNADDVGVIQKRIIQNLYDNPIVICDVSGKNPNVMFELGIRLAFDKPTIIIKDDKTTYSFDTSPIEHLEYPRDLRFNKIEDFKEKLIEKIKRTYSKSVSDHNYSTFLKHFGEFKVAKIDKREVSQQEFIIDEIKSLRRLVLQTSRRSLSRPIFEDEEDETTIDVCCGRGVGANKIEELLPKVLALPGVISADTYSKGDNHNHIILNVTPTADRDFLKDETRRITRSGPIRRSAKK